MPTALLNQPAQNGPTKKPRIVAATEAGRAVAYLRRSTDRQEQSLGDQREAIRAFAEQADLVLVREYTDDAISGSTSEGREAFQRLIADAQSPRRDFDLVLTYDLKRFGRGNNDEAGHYRYELWKAGVEVEYVSEGFKGDDTDDLLRPVKQWQARQELKDLSKVTIRGQLSLSSKGWWFGGVPPFGYDLRYYDAADNFYQQIRFTASGEKQIFHSDGQLLHTAPKGQRVPIPEGYHARLVIGDPDRVAVVKRIFELYVHRGLGFKPIAHQLNKEGIRSPRNGAWSSNHEGHWACSTVRAILVNPIYTGSMVWNRRTFAKFHRISKERATPRSRIGLGRGERNPEIDWVVVPDTHEPIIPKKLFDAARSLRRSRERNRKLTATRGGRAKSSPFLLSGLVKCSDCGHNFQGYRVRRGKRKGAEPVVTQYYCCGGYITKGTTVCERRLFPRANLEGFVLERIATRLERFLRSGGRKILERLVREEIGPDANRDETRRLKNRLGEIRTRIDTLLDSLTPTNKEFVDEKLVVLKKEKDALEARLSALDAPRPKVDVKAVVDAGIAQLGRFRELLDHGTVEEQKTLVQAFVARIDLSSRNQTGAAHFFRLPENCSFELVAGARYEPVQKNLEPPERFIAGGQGLRFVA
jgi:DNA invertase Pin-like site-specific DNA recombinase